jgi:hypothetical protein
VSAEYFRAIPDGERLDRDFIAKDVDGQETHWFWSGQLLDESVSPSDDSGAMAAGR